MKNVFTVLFMIVSFLTSYPQDTIHVPRDYSTIQAGINAAGNGDIVLVEDSTYTENINYRGKAITVASNFIVDGDANHINNTIIDGSQPVYADTGSVVTFNSGEDTNSVLCGFTITGGTGTFSPAGSPPAPPIPTRSGGGILCFLSGARIVQNIIEGNECVIDLADGAAIGGGICTAPPGTSSYVILEKNKIINNSIWSQGSNSAASAIGGGISMYFDGSVKLNEFISNRSKSDHSTSLGGSIYLYGGSFEIYGNIINQNASISIETLGYGGGICCVANAIIDSNQITNNSVSAGGQYSDGAAIYFDLDDDSYYATVENNIIANNTSMNTNGYGGAIGMYTSSPLIINNIITGNTANYGGAFNPWHNSKPVIINNTIAFNNANNAGGAIYSEDPTTNPIVINTIMWNNVAAVSGNEIDFYNGGSATVRYCDITGGWSGEGNIDVDPVFVNPLYNLIDQSLCIGAGIDTFLIGSIWYYAPLFDIDGDLRPNPPECMPDIGAQESPFCNPANTFQFSVLVNDGWNMVSVPGTNPDGMDVANWWTNLIGTVYKFVPGSGYSGITTTTPGEGYWLKNVGTETYSYPAIQIVTHDPISATAGWNMFGGYEGVVDVTTLTTTPAGQIVYPIYQFVPGSGYATATTLDPGYGYWVKVASDCQINLPTGQAGVPSAAVSKLIKKKDNYFQDDLPDRQENWGKITITDAAGHSYTLYAVKEHSPDGGAGVDLNKYELPPLPPAGVFDVRYSSGRIAEDINSSVQGIDLSGVTYPIKVKVEGMDIRLQDVTGKAINTNVKSGEEMTVSNPTINKLMVTGQLLPVNFALEQNFPNPFNPTTTIKFSIPKEVQVNLVIYDILGGQIKELKNEIMKPGYYEVNFNASSLASGIYFYRIKAGDFVSTKKMLLLK